MIVNNELCDVCGACVSVCPVDAISVTEFSVCIDFELCIRCNNCKIICPARAIFDEEE